MVTNIWYLWLIKFFQMPFLFFVLFLFQHNLVIRIKIKAGVKICSSCCMTHAKFVTRVALLSTHLKHLFWGIFTCVSLGWNRMVIQQPPPPPPTPPPIVSILCKSQICKKTYLMDSKIFTSLTTTII